MKRQNALALPLFFLGTLFLSTPLRAADLTGRVLDAATKAPVAGANVMVSRTLLGDVTDLDGRFSVERVPEGLYSIRVSMLGYRSLTVDGVLAAAGGNPSVEILMQPAPVTGEPVIVTAAKHVQELGAAYQAVQTVDQNRISMRQSRNIEESLNAVSGVHFNENNISIRGSSGYSVFNVGSRVLLMVDGVPVLTSDLGAVNWKILPLLEVDRIEVVKGAGSALYGSSAMGGVVNIITRAPESKGRVAVRLSSGFYDAPAYPVWKWTDRTLHSERADLTYSGKIGGAGLRLSASRSVSTGYMENNDLDQWNASGRLDYSLKNGSRVELSASWMKSREGGFIQWINQNQPFRVPPFNKDDELLYSMLNTYALVHWPVSASFGLRLRVSYLQSELGNQLTTFNPSAFDPGRGPGVEIQGDWIPHPLHQITFGSELRWDLSGSQYFGNHRGFSISPYAQEEWTVLENLKASAGVRMDSHVLTGESNDTRVSPKCGLNYRPGESTAVRVSAGAGFRAATVFEKFIAVDYSGFAVIPNPDLRSERSWTVDAGVRQSVSSNVQMDLSVFQSDYWDMIEPFVNFLGTIQFQNFVRARIRGIEASCESWWWRRRLGLEANWCVMDPRNVEQGTDLPYRPRQFGALTGSVRLGPALFQAEWRYASRIRSVELNPLDPRVPVKLLSLRGELRWRNLTFQLSVNNALNYHYTQVERRMGEVRNANVTVMGRF
jgi:outer membrane receptor for ferrienterochelin and colicins